jgi:hypothetical protein
VVDSFEIMVMVPIGEDTQEAQQLSENDNNDNDHDEEEEDHEAEEDEDNEDEDKDDEDYTPSSDSEKEKIYHNTDEIKTARNEALIPTGRLRDLLNRIKITNLLEFRIKRVPGPG